MRIGSTVLNGLGASGAGLTATLLSTFAGERRAQATYPDIMGCEVSCEVVATGWPFVFVRDYTGMSLVNSADITEVIFAGDRLDWAPFAADVVLWSAGFLLLIWALRRGLRASLR
ncbi:MAG: hypothetical protein JHD15_19820 [Phenylobacterium sp.]|uniref:hypothetical protein n=1 Tax=Phenylobacterium sp. TaxID=1871053 RepID=UPI001A2EDF61|nr:hypothetical protein [Phenylobacterium sp.]MBJ7412586.1 hypothetical protein [Phenylobacterium sp.]